MLFPAESAQSEKLHVSVTVKLRKAAAFIIFRSADLEHPMYAVDNKSSKPVMVWQEGGNPKVNGSMVFPGKRVPYSWDRPHDSRVLMLCVEGGRDVQNVKMEKFSKFKCKGMLIAEVLADGCTRALRIADESKSDDSSSVADSEVGEFATSTLTLEFAGAGVSLVDSKLEEILLAAVLDVKALFRSTRTDHEFELKVLTTASISSQRQSHCAGL